MLGDPEGEALGVPSLGDALGLPDGDPLGEVLGEPDGDPDGDPDGLFDGTPAIVMEASGEVSTATPLWANAALVVVL